MCITFAKYIKTLSYSGIFVSFLLKTNNPKTAREVLWHNKGKDIYVIYINITGVCFYCMTLINSYQLY